MQHLEGSGTPVLYVGRTVLKGLTDCKICKLSCEKKKLLFFFCMHFQMITQKTWAG